MRGRMALLLVWIAASTGCAGGGEKVDESPGHRARFHPHHGNGFAHPTEARSSAFESDDDSVGVKILSGVLQFVVDLLSGSDDSGEED